MYNQADSTTGWGKTNTLPKALKTSIETNIQPGQWDNFCLAFIYIHGWVSSKHDIGSLANVSWMWLIDR